MKKTIKLTCVLLTLTLLMIGCGSKTATNNAKPANAPGNTATNSSSNTGNSNTSSNTDKPKNEIKDEKSSKPKDTKKQPNAATVPAEWIYYADEERGYGFSLPKGSEGESSVEGNVDTFVAETPEKITVIVYAFKDPNLTKEDLLDRAEKALNAMGETVKTGKLTNESEDYAIADATSESKDGEKSNLKVLVATDVTDNYVMFVRSSAADYEKNKATMDMIWGSFEMYSGGSSGNN